MKRTVPTISVLLPTYNEQLSWIQTAIQSIQTQTIADWELIIVLDQPNRIELWEYLQQLSEQDQRIVCIKNAKNLGLASSLNEGAKYARGQYIARMDADDRATANRLSVQLAFMEAHPEIALCGSQVQKMDEEENLLSESSSPQCPSTIRKMARYINIMTHPTFFMRKEAFDRVSGYRDLPGGEDYDIVLRLLAEGYELANLSEVLLYYRVRRNGETLARSCTQKVCFRYVQNLYRRRLKTGTDTFDSKHIRVLVQEAIDQYGTRQNQAQALLVQAKEAWAKRSYIHFSFLLLRSLQRSPIQRQYYWDWLRAAILQMTSPKC